jgi:adenosylcobinamide-GDP ribazoletransferase
VFTVLIQVVALAYAGFVALVTACVAGRLALTWACRAGVPAARPDGLGATVAGTVRPAAPWLVTLAALAATAFLGLTCDLGVWTGQTSAQDAPEHFGGMVTGAAIILDEAYYAKDYSAFLTPGPGEWIAGPLPAFAMLPLGLLAGLVAALALLRRARRRLGGITGDVLGALVETATAGTLVACAVFSAALC